MSSPSPLGGSLYGILVFLGVRGCLFFWNSRIPSDFSLEIIEFLGILDCQKPKGFICYFARALRKYQVLLAFFLSKKQARKID